MKLPERLMKKLRLLTPDGALPSSPVTVTFAVASPLDGGDEDSSSDDEAESLGRKSPGHDSDSGLSCSSSTRDGTRDEETDEGARADLDGQDGGDTPDKSHTSVVVAAAPDESHTPGFAAAMGNFNSLQQEAPRYAASSVTKY